MKIGPSDSYLCLIPNSTTIPSRSEEDTPDSEMTPARSWSLLQPLAGTCLYVCDLLKHPAQIETNRTKSIARDGSHILIVITTRFVSSRKRLLQIHTLQVKFSNNNPRGSIVIVSHSTQTPQLLPTTQAFPSIIPFVNSLSLQVLFYVF
jgi:hypothetical protein